MKIVADLHTHTVASGHAYSTVKENIQQARDRGLMWMGVSDHAPGMSSTTDINYFTNLKVLPTQLMGVTLLRGVELNILNEGGEVDLPDDILEGLDYAIASLHNVIFPSRGMNRNTDAVAAAMQNSYVRIIGHPDDDRLPLDYEGLVFTAKEFHVALEANNSSLGPTSYRKNAADNLPEMLRLCVKQEVSIIVSSDSHFYCDVGNFDRAAALLKQLKFPPELVINASVAGMHAFLNQTALQPVLTRAAV